MRPFLALALACLGCGSEPSPTTIDPEPPPVEPTEVTEATEAEAADPEDAPGTPPAPEPPASDEVRGATVERAIEPLADVVAVAASVEVGTTRYVLYRLDGAALARARIEAEPDGAYRYEVIRDALDSCEDDHDDYAVFACRVGAAPDPYLAAAWICPVRQWGVAVVEARDGGFVRTARRSLYAMSCEPTRGPRPRVAPSIEARDLDADGLPELDVRFSVTVAREDAGMTGGTDGALRFVLDARTLRTQLALTTEYDATFADVAGTAASCEATVTFSDTDADGHDDVQIQERCREDRVDERRGGARGRDRRPDTDCPWDPDTDAWVCARPLARQLFDTSQEGLVAERPEDLGVRGLGADVARQLAEARAEDAAYEVEEAEEADDEDEDEDEPAAAVAPPPAVAAPAAPATCRSVVDDPAPPLRVRAEPTSRSEARGELANGTALVLVERRGGWARVEAPVAGWVYTQSLRGSCD